MKDWKLMLLVGGGAILIMVAIVSICMMGPYFEARTFRKLTGKDVSTWDAIWVELRVDGCR